MKISLNRLTQFLSTGVLVFAITLIATQSPVNAVTAKLAQANNEKALQDLLGKMNGELTRRTTELEKSSTNLNGEKATGATTGEEAKECADGDKSTQAALDKTNKDSAQASFDLSKLTTQAKTSKDTATAQQTAKDADAKYDEYKIANTQNNIMNALCTQKDAQSQLDTLIKQAQAMQEQSESSESSGSSGSSESSGGDMDISEMISQVIQIAAAIAAIIASIVALVQAIQNNDMAAAAAIFTTIMTQLAAVADMLLGGEGEITEIISALSGSSSGEGDDVPNAAAGGS